MAALDSFAVEPMTALHIFHSHKGFILSPHIGGVTSDAYINMGVAAAQNILEGINIASFGDALRVSGMLESHFAPKLSRPTTLRHPARVRSARHQVDLGRNPA